MREAANHLCLLLSVSNFLKSKLSNFLKNCTSKAVSAGIITESSTFDVSFEPFYSAMTGLFQFCRQLLKH